MRGPLWVCEKPREFAETFQERQKQPLLLAKMPEGIRMVGLSYLKGLQQSSTSMLARVREQPVIVWVERADDDRTVPKPAPSTGLNLIQEYRGDLVFYELTPHGEAEVIDYFYEIEELPPADAAWSDIWQTGP